MQKCEGCGAYYSDFDKVCPHCGRASELVPQEEEKPEQDVSDTQARNPWAKTSPEPEKSYRPYETEDQAAFTELVRNPAHPMKWHKFLMVILVIGSVVNIFTGFTMIISPDPSSVTTDILFGIAVVGIGVFQFFVRNRLNAFRKGSPNLLMLLYVANAAVNVLSMLTPGESVSAIPGISGTNNVLIYLVGIGIYMFLNYYYYNKRKDMFVK